MSEKEERKEFVEPELTKSEESLDEITMGAFIGTPPLPSPPPP